MEMRKITSTDLKNKMDSHQPFILIDCREENEWNEGHIKGAILLPLSRFADQYKEILKDKEQIIITQCRSGQRSKRAAQFLVAEGYQNVYNLEGGILGWEANQYPITND